MTLYNLPYVKHVCHITHIIIKLLALHKCKFITVIAYDITAKACHGVVLTYIELHIHYINAVTHM